MLDEPISTWTSFPKPSLASPQATASRDEVSPITDQPAAPPVWRWLAAALDELDYGIVLLLPDSRVIHINHAARVELGRDHPLQVRGGGLRPRSLRDCSPLHEAIREAVGPGLGLRRLLTLYDDGRRFNVSVVPLDAADGEARAVLLVLGKLAVSESLSIQAFARNYQLTDAETRVLVSLCSGLVPSQAAMQLGVAISTIRSQIGSIRSKTGAPSIRALLRQVSVLPPLKSALRAIRPQS